MERITKSGLIALILGAGMTGWSIHNPDVLSCIQNYFNSTESRVETFNRVTGQKHKTRYYSQTQLTAEENQNLYRDTHIGAGGILVSALGFLLLLGSAVSYGKTSPQISASGSDGGGTRRRKLFANAQYDGSNPYRNASTDRLRSRR